VSSVLRPAIEAEQRAVHATLTDIGPDAPTLCTGWTTRELAAHLATGVMLGGALAVGGRLLIARVPVRMGAAGARVNDRLVRARRSFDASLARLARRPPALVTTKTTAPITLAELWVHHEDVRRANGMGPRPEPAELAAAVDFLVRYQRRLFAAAGLTVIVLDGRVDVTGARGGTASVHGPAGELLVWLAGRRPASTATITGDDDVAARIAVVPLSI